MKVVKSSFSAKELTSRNLLENGEADSDAPGRSTVGEEEISSTSHELFTDSDVVKREAESMSRRSLSSNTAYEYKDIYLIELISGALDVGIQDVVSILSKRLAEEDAFGSPS
ncbi:hypothetical protein AAHA92_05696 [Salvia divinorum]|uniref:Uncharacterized protein n=1 Tax=Salvia divinorum TaxID=28513 RepID=A0ABD1I387_SALDI